MVENTLFPYKISPLEGREGIVYVTCKNAAFVHISKLDDFIGKEMKYPAKLNGFIVLICTRGELSLTVHMNDYTLKQNMLLIAPTSVIDLKQCKDCEIYLAAFNNEFAADMNIDMRMIMPVITSLNSQCVVHKIDSQKHIDSLCNTYKSLREEYMQPCNDNMKIYREMALRHMYASIVYRICELVVAKKSLDSSITPKDRSGDYFKQLVSLLHQYYKTERSVEFYADQMNLTPKHLSRVVRNYSGKSVHQWIDEFVVLEIKNLLKYSDMSIQQISYELNFPNPSFMGQYFKRITGKTPGQYRREI